MTNWITGKTRKSWKQLERFRIQTKSSHDMHRRSQAQPAEGISNPLESPVTYTESRNVFIKLYCNYDPVNGCRSMIAKFLNYCLDEMHYLQRVPV